MKRPTLGLVEQMTRDAINVDSSAAELERYAHLLDELTPPTRDVSPLAAALWYAEHGLHVFPIQPRMKTPYERSHGYLDATTDVERITRWWTTAPRSNIGIATGHLVDVIDIDGEHGNTSIAHTEGLPHVLGWVSTPRAGGRHLYVVADEHKHNRAHMAPGVDYRGRGGYVVAPPSATDVGTYRWIAPLDL